MYIAKISFTKSVKPCHVCFYVDLDLSVFPASNFNGTAVTGQIKSLEFYTRGENRMLKVLDFRYCPSLIRTSVDHRIFLDSFGPAISYNKFHAFSVQ